MNIFFWNVPTSPMIFSQPPRHFGFFGFFLPHLRHLAAPALPPRCFAYFPFFSQTKSRRKADSHHWHLETFQKLPKIWVQEKPSKANSQNSMSVWKFSSGCSTEKTSLPGDPQTLGSLQWAASPGPWQTARPIPPSTFPQLAHHNQQFSLRIPKNWREIWVNWWIRILTLHYQRLNCLAKVSLTWLFFDIIEHPHTWLCWFTSINCSNCATSQLICLLGLD